MSKTKARQPKKAAGGKPAGGKRQEDRKNLEQLLYGDAPDADEQDLDFAYEEESEESEDISGESENESEMAVELAALHAEQKRPAGGHRMTDNAEEEEEDEGEEGEGEDGGGVAAMADPGAMISEMMALEGPVVSVVVLRTDGKVEEVTVDMTPRLNKLAGILGGPLTIMGEFQKQQTVLLQLREPAAGTAENKHKLPPPFGDERVQGDIVCVRMDDTATPCHFTKAEYLSLAAGSSPGAQAMAQQSQEQSPSSSPAQKAAKKKAKRARQKARKQQTEAANGDAQ